MGVLSVSKAIVTGESMMHGITRAEAWSHVIAALLLLSLCSSASVHGQEAFQKVFQPPGRAGRELAKPAPAPAAPAVVAPRHVIRKYTISVNNIPIDWVGSVVPFDPVDDDVVDVHPAAGQIRIGDASFDHLMFAVCSQDKNETPTERLTVLLRKRIAAVDRICGLEDVQKQKLALAGRGDIRRFMGRVNELKQAYQSHTVDDQDLRGQLKIINDLGRDVEGLRRNNHEGPFFEDSLFVKTMRTCLSAEQLTTLARSNLTSPVVVTRSTDLKPRVTITAVNEVEE